MVFISKSGKKELYSILISKEAMEKLIEDLRVDVLERLRANKLSPQQLHGARLAVDEFGRIAGLKWWEKKEDFERAEKRVRFKLVSRGDLGLLEKQIVNGKETYVGEGEYYEGVEAALATMRELVESGVLAAIAKGEPPPQAIPAPVEVKPPQAQEKVVPPAAPPSYSELAEKAKHSAVALPASEPKIVKPSSTWLIQREKEEQKKAKETEEKKDG